MTGPIADMLVAFVALCPVVTAALWIAGGVLFRALDERLEVVAPPGGWPPVTVLLPAFNEEPVIATSVRAALACDHPRLEVVVLDDGSRDATARSPKRRAAATRACGWCATPSTAGRRRG